MRAREFIIKIDVDDMGEPDVTIQPIHQPQTINPRPTPCSQQTDYDDPRYSNNDEESPDADDAPDVMVSPQQQEIELKKAALGKKSIVAAQLTDDSEDDEIS